MEAFDHMADESRRELGKRVRTEVLGEAHVTRSLDEADDFSLPIQELVMDYAWGEIWSRPGLDRRSRSVLNLGLLAAGGHHHELAVHVRGAVRNGLTEGEIREVLLQTAVYAGMPVALEAFRVAGAVLAQLRDEECESAVETKPQTGNQPTGNQPPEPADRTSRPEVGSPGTRRER